MPGASENAKQCQAMPSKSARAARYRGGRIRDRVSAVLPHLLRDRELQPHLRREADTDVRRRGRGACRAGLPGKRDRPGIVGHGAPAAAARACPHGSAGGGRGERGPQQVGHERAQQGLRGPPCERLAAPGHRELPGYQPQGAVGEDAQVPDLRRGAGDANASTDVCPRLRQFPRLARSARFNASNVRSSVRSKCSGVTDIRPEATTAVSLSAAFCRVPRWNLSQ
jgi:hypothetical protein